MARPPKYNWEPIDKLIEAGMSAGEISRQTGISRTTILSRIKKNSGQLDDSKSLPVKVSEERQKMSKTDENPHQVSATPNTPSELAEIAAQNETLQWLDRIDKIEKNNAVLAAVLQSRIGRCLERNPDLRPCDVSNIAGALATLESLGQTKDELGMAIQTFMKFGLFDKKTSAYLARAVVSDRDATLARLRRVVKGECEIDN